MLGSIVTFLGKVVQITRIFTLACFFLWLPGLYFIWLPLWAASFKQIAVMLGLSEYQQRSLVFSAILIGLFIGVTIRNVLMAKQFAQTEAERKKRYYSDAQDTIDDFWRKVYSQRSWFTVLGVSNDATREVIKSAYRRQAKLLHPDSAPDRKGDPERFKEVTEAYQQGLQKTKMSQRT